MSGKFTSKIPLYNKMSPKRQQQVHMVGGGLALLTVVMIVSGLLEGPAKISAAGGKELPKPRPLAGVPGAQLDARDAWMGDAGKQLARMQDEIKSKDNRIARLEDDQRRDRETMLGQVNELRQRMQMVPVTKKILTAPAGATGAPGAFTGPREVAGSASASAGTPSPRAGTPTPLPSPGTMASPPAPGSTVARGPTAAEVFPAQPRPDRLPAPNGVYPPGAPNTAGARPMMAGGAGMAGAPQGAPVAEPGPGASLIRVSLGPTSTSTTAATSTSAVSAAAATSASPSPGSAQPLPARHISHFLPVGFTKAVLLGGVAAPTGGQAQSNPVPVLLRLADLAVLPNGYRAQVRDCLVIGEAFGDHSAERAYVRTTLLSCVMRDGKVLEVPLKGSVFGEDGMNGIKGPLITKQGQILSNALMAGIASGIGQGISQASQNVTSTALGQVQSAPVDTAGILRGGFGTGVGKALDRLAQYYINLAEKTFPVIEVQPGRMVDVVVTQGVTLDLVLDAITGAPGRSPVQGRDDSRMPLLQALHATDDDE